MGVNGAPLSVLCNSPVAVSTSKMVAESLAKKPGFAEPVMTTSNRPSHSKVLASPTLSSTR